MKLTTLIQNSFLESKRYKTEKEITDAGWEFVGKEYKESPPVTDVRKLIRIHNVSNNNIGGFQLADDKWRIAIYKPSMKEQILNENVAQTILNQLGGRKFLAMTGAKNLIDGGSYLAFKLGRAKDSINYVKITLTSMDLYDMEFGTIRSLNYKVKKEISGVSYDQLRDIFTEYTGLRTSL